MHPFIRQQLLQSKNFTHLLTPEEIENPQLVLQQFQRMMQDPPTCQLLTDLHQAFFSGQPISIDIKENPAIFLIHHQLQRLLEACYLLHLYSQLSNKNNNGPASP